MPYKLRIGFSISLLILFILPAFSIDKGDPLDKVSSALISNLRSDAPLSCMIYLDNQSRNVPNIVGTKEEKGKAVFSHLRNTAKNSQEKLITFLENKQIPHRSFYIVNAISAELTWDQAVEIARFQEVSAITHDSPVIRERVEIERASSSRDGVPEWGLQIIKADSVWAMGIDGSNAVVGGMDTGYDWTHPAIQSKYRGYIDEDNADHNYNWHDAIHEISPLHGDSIVDPSLNPCGLDVMFPCDDGSHGTHTMGTMVGLDGDNIIGVAPGANWIGVRNMERGWGSPSTYIEGFEWFMAPTDLNGENPDPSKSPHVINNSWSCPEVEGCDSTNWAFMDIAINNLRNSGVVVVVSASNNGNNCGRVRTPPAMFEGTFAVAATGIIDTIDGVFIDDIAGYSSWGPVMIDGSFRLKPDISAPGSRVRSSTPGNKYGTSSGTSMAGPHVAGLVALLVSANPNLAGQVDAIEEIIQLTAEPMTKDIVCEPYSADTIPNFIFGYGRINALEAVKSALLFTNTEKLVESNPELKIFPNPVNDRINFKWDGEQKRINVKIMDQMGRLISFNSVENNSSLGISSLPDGIYYLKAMLNNRLITKKIIVNKQ